MMVDQIDGVDIRTIMPGQSDEKGIVLSVPTIGLPVPVLSKDTRDQATQAMNVIHNLCEFSEAFPIKAHSSTVRVWDALNMLHCWFRHENGCDARCSGPECTIEAMAAYLAKNDPTTLFILVLKDYDFCGHPSDDWIRSLEQMSKHPNIMVVSAVVPDSMDIDYDSRGRKQTKKLVRDQDDALVQLLSRTIALQHPQLTVLVDTHDKYRDAAQVVESLPPYLATVFICGQIISQVLIQCDWLNKCSCARALCLYK